MVSCDNAESFAAKGKFIKDNSLKGLAMWGAGGDYQGILLNSIRSAAFSDETTRLFSIPHLMYTYLPTVQVTLLVWYPPHHQPYRHGIGSIV